MNFTASTSVVASDWVKPVLLGMLAATPATIAGRLMNVCSRWARRGRPTLVSASLEDSSTTSSSRGAVRPRSRSMMRSRSERVAAKRLGSTLSVPASA
jgi:hypothetical protein